jgi:hypothetical protein
MTSPASFSESSPYQMIEGGLRVAVRLQPKASRDEIVGVEAGPGRAAHLKVRVTAAPESGKANAALEKLLAKTWRIAPSLVSVVTGGKSREKSVMISGDGAALRQKILDWQEARSRA